MSSNLTDEAKKLSVAERIVLVEEIWPSNSLECARPGAALACGDLAPRC